MSVSVIRYSAVCLMAVSFLSSSALADYNCTKSPDCASLGYTVNASDCDEGIKVLCPTDMSKAFCQKKLPEAPLPILYGDGTVDKKILADKTPIGIVFDTDNKLAVALTDVKKDGTAGSETMYWSENYCDVFGLTNCEYDDGDPAIDSCGVDGRANTDATFASTCLGTTYAANAVNAYNPNGCSKDFCKETKWFLPSMRDLAKIYSNKAGINASLSLLNSFGAKTLTENYYWSSTEQIDDSIWSFAMNSGGSFWGHKSNDESYVRPVVKY